MCRNKLQFTVPDREKSLAQSSQSTVVICSTFSDRKICGHVTQKLSGAVASCMKTTSKIHAIECELSTQKQCKIRLKINIPP